MRLWHPGWGENPDLAYLACADVIVVTGQDEFVLAEAAASGNPVYICPIRRRLGMAARLGRWVEARAHARPLNRRGTVRPQQGLEYLCARLIERGIILPPRDLSGLHEKLIRRGIAKPFGAALKTGSHPALREADEVARRIHSLLGWSAIPATAGLGRRSTPRWALEACTQPQCLMRSEGMDPNFVADLIVRLMAGKDVDVARAVAPEQMITPHERCIQCVRDVMREKGPLPTIEERRRMIEAGRRSWQRARRALRHETYRAENQPSKAGF